MSSAVQTPSSVSGGAHRIGTSHRPQVDATYAVESMRALASAIDTLAAHVIKGVDSSNPIAATAQIFNIQQALTDGHEAMKATISEQMLREGGDHVYFISTTQRPQGRWIKDTYELLVAVRDTIRDGLRDQRESASLSNELLTHDSLQALSLPRLMRAFAKSSFFTGFYLNSAAHRAELGITADFSDRRLSRYLANNTNVV